MILSFWEAMPFFPVLLLFLFVSGRVDMSLSIFWGGFVSFPETQKKSSATWVFPKIMVPPKSSHFNRVFHSFHHPFWGAHPYCWKHPHGYKSPSETPRLVIASVKGKTHCSLRRGWGKPLAGWWLSFNPVGKYAQVKLGGNLPKGSGWT